jgi:hypothetical protein
MNERTEESTSELVGTHKAACVINNPTIYIVYDVFIGLLSL